MTEAHTTDRVVFVDESGHTGPDLLNQAEPVLVVAAVSIPLSQVDGLRATVEQLRGNVGLPANARLKFSGLRRSPRGRQAVELALAAAEGAEGILYGTLIEKRAHIASMMVQSYLDPEHNHRAPPQTEASLRQELSNIILRNTTTDLLRSFVDALRDENKELAVEVGRRLADQLELNHADEVRFFGQVVRAGLPNIFWFSERVPDQPDRMQRPNPLVHAFLPMLARMDAHLHSRGEMCAVVADEDRQFGPVLDFGLDVVLRPNVASAQALSEFGCTSKLGCIRGYERRPEEEEPCLVLADFASGVVRHVVLNRLSGGDVDGSLRSAWDLVHTLMLRSEGCWHAVLSQQGWEANLIAR